MKSVAADHARSLRYLFPVDDGHVLVLSAEPFDDHIDLRPIGPELGHRQEQRWPWCQTIKDLVELGLVRDGIASIVAPEEYNRSIPIVVARPRVGVEHLVEHLVSKVHEAARLGLDLSRPTQWHEFLAELPAIPR
jgi:hypothetical protein